MFKKFFSFILTFFIIFMSYIPVFANNEVDINNHAVINASFKEKLNVNKLGDNQIVQFVSAETYKTDSGFTIPSGTIFTGKVKSHKKSRFAFRRAKARIVIDEMTLPNGKSYKIKGRTHRKVLKGSLLGNIAKGVVCTPVALVVLVAGSAVMLVEAVTIVGLLVIVPTGVGVGDAVGKITNGVNCKKSKGDIIKINVVLPHSLQQSKSLPYTKNSTTQENSEILD